MKNNKLINLSKVNGTKEIIRKENLVDLSHRLPDHKFAILTPDLRTIILNCNTLQIEEKFTSYIGLKIYLQKLNNV